MIRRKFTKALVGFAFICVLAGVSRANGIIDPAMRVLDDDFSNAILQGTTFFPNGQGGGVFGFFNGLGQTITELTLQTTIAPGLSQSDIALAFTCNQGNSNPFFENCSISYVGATGQLQIAFWGTNPLTGNETGNLVGAQKGIPSLLPGCISNPDVGLCTSQGHFAISLSNSFALDDLNGDWSLADNPVLFPNGTPTIIVTQIQTTFGAVPGVLATPEPATLGLAGLALAGLVWLKKRRRRVAES